MLWGFFKEHQSTKSIIRNKGLAKLGDSLINLCYSLAKSEVLMGPTGEKVRDSVLAQAIRDTPVYQHIGRRTDSGVAADAYEAIMAYIWLTGKITIDKIVSNLVQELDIDSETNRKREGEVASRAFQKLLLGLMNFLPDQSE
ncbi:MAG: ribonuclease III family protein [Candidatus Thorarchaeota archaeon]|jgi:dsRNA-specific ribonuclease